MPAQAGIQLIALDYSLRSPFGPPDGRSTRKRFCPAFAGMTEEDSIKN
jgi:hypothetical protein